MAKNQKDLGNKACDTGDTDSLKNDIDKDLPRGSTGEEEPTDSKDNLGETNDVEIKGEEQVAVEDKEKGESETPPKGDKPGTEDQAVKEKSLKRLKPDEKYEKKGRLEETSEVGTQILPKTPPVKNGHDGVQYQKSDNDEIQKRKRN